MQTIDEQLREASLDLEDRLRRGEDASAADVQSDRAALWRDEDAALELIFTEMVVRGELGVQRPAEEWFRLYPQWSDRLRRLVEIHGAMDVAKQETASPADTTTDTPTGESLKPATRRVGDYELLEEIDRGGMGVVYKARQIGLNRIVAVKMVLAGAHAADEDRERFLREAEATGRLQHPNIVQIHEIGEQDGVPFLSMEFVDGPSLEELLSEWHGHGSTGISATDAARLVRTLAEAMHDAHRQGIVHRDLKPANVLLRGVEVEKGKAESGKRTTNDGPLTAHRSPLTPCIADFGLAKLLDQSTTRTASGALLGTPSYMAPEQVNGTPETIGPQTDVYALGGILYELLTGRPPFRGMTMVETLEQVRRRDPVSPRQLQPGVPRDLETICLKCLEKEPTRRYATAEALAEDLARFLKNEPIHARPTTPWERGRKWIRRRPAVAALLGTVLLLTAGSFAAITHLWLDARDARDAQAVETEKAAKRSAETLIALARSEWTRNRIEQAKTHLRDCPPRFRNREWQYLHRVCHAELQRLPTKAAYRIHDVVFAPDGKRVASCDARGAIVWDVGTGHRWFQVAEEGAVRCCFVPGGTRLHVLADRFNWRGSLPAVRQLALCAFDGTGARIGVDRNYEPVYRRTTGSGDSMKVAFSLGPRMSSNLTILDLTTGAVRSRRCSSFVGGATVSRSGRYLAYAEKQKCAILDTIKGRVLPFRCSIGSDAKWTFSHDETRIALAYGEKEPSRTTLGIFDIASGKRLLVINDRTRPIIRALAFSPDDRRVASGGDQRRIDIWDTTTGDKLLTLRGHAGLVHFLCFSPDGTHMASAAMDGTIRIWDVRSLD